MITRLAKVVLFLFIVVAVAVTPALAQLTTGSVSGTVVDPTGAVIPGATVTLTNEATGVTREVQTNQVGTFVMDRVRPGSYTLRITVSGFRTFETRDMIVSVGKVAGLKTVTMEVGATTDVVEVEMGTVPLLQADSPEITGRYDARVVADVMAGSFGLDALSFLTAGVVPGFGNINTNSTGFGDQIGGDAGAVPAAAGQRGRSTQFSMDGHEVNDITIGGPSIFIDNLDTIAEYQVTVNSFDASTGRLPGAQVNIITKSGTNDIHGSVFYFYESNYLRAKTAQEDQADEDKPKEIQQPFGFTVGGPLIKNKWFGFGSYRKVIIPGGALAQTNSLSLTSASAAAVAAAAGTNSTALYAAQGPFNRPLGNPRCRPGTQTTLTDFGGSGVDADACGMVRDIAQSEVLWEYSLRMDVVTDTVGTFTGRWFDQFDDFCCDTFGGTAGYVTGVPFRGQSLSFGHTYQFTPRAINDFRFSYGRFKVGFEGGNTFPVSSFSDNVTRVNLPPPLLDFGLFTNIPQGRLLYNFQYQDNFSYTFGRHTVKMGLEYRRNRTSAPFLPDANGQFNYATITEFVNDTATSTEFTSGAFSFQPFETDQFYYVQDDFRIRPNFVLNLGLRYENTGQPINVAVDEVLKRESDPTTALFLQSLPLDQRTIARVSNDKNNWGPRIGFTYTPRFAEWLFGEEKSVIRGGYGIAYEAAFYNILLNITTRAPRVFGFTLVPGIGIPGDGTGNAVANAIPVPVNQFDPREFGQTNVPTGFSSPYTQNWSLGIQREIGSSVVGELRYRGSRQIGQFQSVNTNPDISASFPLGLTPAGVTPCAAGSAPSTFQDPDATQGRVFCDRFINRIRQNSARANFHGFESRLDFRNLFDQLTGGFAFTWSKTIDNVSEIFNFSDSGSRSFAQNPFDVVDGERGLSNIHLGRTMQTYWIWDVPVHREQQGALGKLLGGWQYNGSLFLYDGRPYTAVQFLPFGNPVCEDIGFNTTFVGSFSTCRPYLANPNAPATTVGNAGDPGVRWWINDGTLGAAGAGRNQFPGDGVVLSNMGFFKNTRFGAEGRFNVQFRTMVVNIFNHRNFGVPSSIFIEDSDSSVIGGTGDFGRPNRNDAGGRIIRFALRFQF